MYLISSASALLDRVTFPLAANGPLFSVNVSGCLPGTYDESVDTRGLERSGFTSPFKAVGRILGEIFTGATLQEVWEAGLQQVYLLLSLAFSLVALAVLFVALTVAGAHGATIGITMALGFLATFFIVSEAVQFQTAGSEEESHAISLLAAMQFDGVTEERARQQFVDNLPDYGYSALSGKTESQLYAEVNTDRPYAQKWLNLPKTQALARELQAIVTAEPASVQIAQQVAQHPTT